MELRAKQVSRVMEQREQQGHKMEVGHEGRGGGLGISISGSIQCPLQPVPVSTYGVTGVTGKHVLWMLSSSAHSSVREIRLAWPRLTGEGAVS